MFSLENDLRIKRYNASAKSSTNHTFAICAYKECDFLEDNIKSIVGQTIKSNVIMSTSTPNQFIIDLANKYDLPLYINEGEGSAKDNWNFAYSMAITDYVTIVHQDDIYEKNYFIAMQKFIQKEKDILVIYTDHLEQFGNDIKRTLNTRIKRIINFPLRFRLLHSNRSIRKLMLSVGNPICCSSATYNKLKLPTPLFVSELKYCMDWDLFYQLSGLDGKFIYIDTPLLHHRVHKEAMSVTIVKDGNMARENLVMFKKFWPDPLANLIMRLYRKSMNIYIDG